MKLWKLGCRWGSKSKHIPFFYEFIKSEGIIITWVDHKMEKNDWVMLTDGYSVLAFAQLLEPPFSSTKKQEYEKPFNELQIPYEGNLKIAKAKWIELEKDDIFLYESQKGIHSVVKPEILNKFKKLLKKYISKMNIENNISILKYKKQIILQGPPGTGKTRLAKQIANELTGRNESFLSVEFIKNSLNVGQKINGASNQIDYYTVEKINDSNVVLTSEFTKKGGHYAKFNKVIEYYRKLTNLEEVKASRSHDSYELAVAKHFFSKTNHGDVKIIQFHPSYTYEDFVRGITVKSNEKYIEYITENRILGKIAKEALQNFLDSEKESEDITYEKWLVEQFEQFKQTLIDTIDKSGEIQIAPSVKLVQVGNQYFKYEGSSWHNYIKYSFFLDLYKDGIFEISEIRKLYNIDTRAGYYAKMLKMFQDYLKEKGPTYEVIEKVKLKNFVLIIDEINRANLSSVLGELIYALEYRGEVVHSLYEMENGDNTLILPPNLYIIGTMNTADRSVGQIDYAIRRRFAFVDVLPQAIDPIELNKDKKEGDLELFFATSLFDSVELLFVKSKGSNERSDYLMEEFDAKDVQLGHSYFIYTANNLKLKLEYEIKPILKEYIKDGILRSDANVIIDNLNIN